MKFSVEKTDNIIRMYKEGKTQKEIADYYNTFNTSIRRVLLRSGVKIRSNSEISAFVRPDVFDDLKSNEVNYWLGWLISDGCVYKGRVTLQVQEKDLEVIEAFKVFLGGKVVIKKITHSKSKKIGYRIDFRRKEVEKKLISYGITPKKSLTLKLNTPLNFPMLLGIFEGDGCFIFLGPKKTQGRLFITSGSKDFLKQIQEFLLFHGIDSTITNGRNGVFNLNVYKKQQLILLYTKLYDNASFFLKRKKEKFGSFIEKSLK